MRTAWLLAQEGTWLPAQGTRTALHQRNEAGARLSGSELGTKLLWVEKKKGGVIVLKLCGKFIENLRVFRKRLKNCVMPWSPLAGVPWKRLSPLVSPWHRQNGEGASLGPLLGE